MLHVMTLDLIKGHALSSSHKESLHIWDLKVMWIYLFYNLDDVMERHKCLEKLKNPSNQSQVHVNLRYCLM